MAVDYVKTGQPAQMTRDLKPPKWPHFMEKQHLPADRIYTSKKVLGQLYDHVERVNFVPLYTAPFDDRILRAYRSDVDLLENVRGIKKEYDAHLRRIMAQHEIKSEFEVWSTFVLQHSRTTNAFKFHEVIWELSVALKEQFRTICCEQAGGKDFQKLAPFVAAMYEITSTEMAGAVLECHRYQDHRGHQRPLRDMTIERMPLMSFPWLFPDILGKIAKGVKQKVDETVPFRQQPISRARTARRGLEVVQEPESADRSGRSEQEPTILDVGDDIETAGGVTYRGDMLELFETRAMNHSSPQAAAASPNRSESEKSLAPMSRSFSNNSSSVGTSYLVDLKTGSSSDTNSFQFNVNHEGAGLDSSREYLQTLRNFQSNFGIDPDGSGVRLGNDVTGKDRLSSPPKSSEDDARKTFEDTQDEKLQAVNGGVARNKDQYLSSEESDAEVEEISISLNQQSDFLDRLAVLGEDNASESGSHNTEAKSLSFQERAMGPFESRSSLSFPNGKNSPTWRVRIEWQSL